MHGLVQTRSLNSFGLVIQTGTMTEGALMIQYRNFHTRSHRICRRFGQCQMHLMPSFAVELLLRAKLLLYPIV
jgi:hypothetical protein